jgi:NADPH-dependent 2,4-dienoyl-CoA reductase/sulfur reductase-like enzyme
MTTIERNAHDRLLKYLIVGAGLAGVSAAQAICECDAKRPITIIGAERHLPYDRPPLSHRSIRILKGRKPVSVEHKGQAFIVMLSDGEKIESDLVVGGIGIKPAIGPAERVLSKTGDGIIVNEYLQTSHPDIFAAGDNVRLSNPSTGQSPHMEHWDNARSQGRHAGRNMACSPGGKMEAFTYIPYFFSDLFEFGYEAVGEVDSRMETIADWKKPFDTGIVYYLKDGRIRGVMMCNVWEKVEEVRGLIRRGAGANDRLKLS